MKRLGKVAAGTVFLSLSLFVGLPGSAGAQVRASRTMAVVARMAATRGAISLAGSVSGASEALPEGRNPATAYTRFDWCSIATYVVSTLVVEDGEKTVTGTARVTVAEHAYWSRSSRSWDAQQVLLEGSEATATGDLKVATLEAEAQNTCTGGCKVTSGRAYVRAVPREPASPAGEAIALTAPGSGTVVDHLHSVWTFVTPSGPAEPPATMTTAPVRCDSLRGNISLNGCVDPEVVPTYTLSSVNYPNIALFDAAQIRAHPSWQVLQRTTDGARIDANRRAACRGFKHGKLPGGQKDSCDEFPYASTLQGPGRTEHVDLDENSAQGRDLGGFYTSNRLITGDKFCVQVSPPLPGLALPSCPPSIATGL
jgi:hypothetical protein